MTPKCSSCKQGEIDENATCKVVGHHWTSSGKWMPYTANLCDDHLDMITVDGAKVKVVKVY